MENFTVADFLLYLFLLIALAAGWFLGRRSVAFKQQGVRKLRSGPPSRDYFIGLNYLLNDEPDDAIDVFTDFLEIGPGTLDTYIALGKLLRRRGKVDQSITIYQDLLGKGSFSQDDITEIKLHLVQSYIAAGLLDRAELILEELKNASVSVRSRALEFAISLAQQEREWKKGISSILDLIRITASERRDSLQVLASHFYCELAQGDMDNGHIANARSNLKLASDMDRMNPRVSMLRGELERQSGNVKEAIKYFQRVSKQDPVFLADVFDQLVSCFQQAGKEKALRKFVDECMATNNNTTVLLGIAAYLRVEQGIDVARDFLEKKLQSKKSLRLLQHRLMLDEGLENDRAQRDAQVLNMLTDYLDSQPQYQCENCGFELKTLHWLCPSCASWGTVRYQTGILGE